MINIQQRALVILDTNTSRRIDDEAKLGGWALPWNNFT